MCGFPCLLCESVKAASNKKAREAFLATKFATFVSISEAESDFKIF